MFSLKQVTMNTIRREKTELAKSSFLNNNPTALYHGYMILYL